MLILTRKPGESLYIGDDVKITIVEIKGNQIRVGIDAPTDLRIYREEIYVQILEENRTAAESITGQGFEKLTENWTVRRGDSDGENDESSKKKDGFASFNKFKSASLRTSHTIGKTNKKEGGTKSPEIMVRSKRNQDSDG